jgi:hypothetical protein
MNALSQIEAGLDEPTVPAVASAVFADAFGVLLAEGKLSMANGMIIAHSAEGAVWRANIVAADLARRAGA